MTDDKNNNEHIDDAEDKTEETIDAGADKLKRGAKKTASAAKKATDKAEDAAEEVAEKTKSAKDKVVDHLKKHKKAYIIGGVVVGVTVVGVVVFKRASAASAAKDAAQAAIEAEPLLPYVLGEGEHTLTVAVRHSQADAFNKAAEVVKNSPIVSVDGERYRMPDTYLTGSEPLKIYDDMYKVVKDKVGDTVDKIFTVDEIPKLRPVHEAA